MKRIINLLFIFSLLATSANAQYWKGIHDLLKRDSIKIGDSVLRQSSFVRWGAGGATGGVAWGSITGTLSGQTDLQNALNLKANLASPTFSGSVNFGASTASGSNAIVLSTNATVAAANAAQLGGQNTVISSGATGAVSVGTDATISANSPYAFVANDANIMDAESGSAFGFGNRMYDDNGFTIGQDNINGALTAPGTSGTYFNSFTGGSRTRTVGNRAWAFGRLAVSTADDAITFGTGVDGSTSTGDRLVNNTASSFAVGFNSTVPTFQVLTASGAGTYGQTKVNGTLSIGGHITTSGTSPSVAQTGLGTGGAVGVAVEAGSNDTQGIITLTTGNTGVGSSGTVTLTFNSAFSGNNPTIILTLISGSGAWGALANAKVTTQSLSAPVITWVNSATGAAAALSTGTTYKIAYMVIQK